MREIFIEAESFAEKGGWVVEQQSMETIHSAYLMAHGMGVPVADAVTEITVPHAGDYRVWVLTRDWTAVWGVKDPAGRFSLLIDGEDTGRVLGTEGSDWGWQEAGCVTLKAGPHRLALHDLTGFNGRCDALYLTTGENKPEDDIAAIDRLRQRLGWREVADCNHTFELIVVGGGVAGVCTALAAARSGVKTCLIHDRPVLGGCNSSEVQVCMGGMINLPPYENIGNIVREIAPVHGNPSVYGGEYFEDHRKKAAFETREGNWGRPYPYTLALNECVTAVETEGGRVTAVISTHTLTGKKTRYRATLFSDCSGDAVVARLAGAETMYGREAKSVFGESLAPDTHEDLVMGHSIRWYAEEAEGDTPFPVLDWNMPLDDDSCLDAASGDWEQETGFTRHMVSEVEYIRDYGLRAIYTNWSYQKNHFRHKEKYARARLKWVSPLGGKRESFRVKGRYILTQQDIEEHRCHKDGTACLTWSIDMHFPEPTNQAQFGEAFRSFAYHRGIVEPYPVPYRCLYAADISNLFLGGRLVSASHVAFSAVRVMRTLGELGEVVGLAAAVCKEEGCTPDEVYEQHLEKLIEKLRQGVPQPCPFACDVGDEEAYHFKDMGWLHLHPYHPVDPKHIPKFKRGIAALGLEHKYPLPDELK